MVSFGLTWNNTTLIHIWASPGPGDSGPYLGIIGTWLLSSLPGPPLDLVTLVTVWTSPTPDDCGPTLPHLDEVTGSHRDLTWTW